MDSVNKLHRNSSSVDAFKVFELAQNFSDPTSLAFSLSL